MSTQTEAPKRLRWQSWVEFILGAFGFLGIGWLCAQDWIHGLLLFVLASPIVLAGSGFLDARLGGRQEWLGIIIRVAVAWYSAAELNRHLGTRTRVLIDNEHSDTSPR